jgi:acetyl esterase/lipase
MTKPLLILLMTATIASAQTARPSEVRPLWPEGVPGKPAAVVAETDNPPGTVAHVSVPTLAIYPAPVASNSGAAVVICPGGGYQRLAIDKEGYAIAAWLNKLGVSVFVLKYRVPDFGHPAPLQDVLRAIRTVRRDAVSWGIDPSKIGVMGFSAGGHLAASASTLYDDPAGKTGAAIDTISARPDFSILVYPVIMLEGPFIHSGSRDALLGPNAPADKTSALSLQNRVDARTPPVFLVHGGDDKAVPAENSVAYFMAARNAGVPAEIHVYQHGPHGFGTLPGHGPISDWTARCEEWLRVKGLIRDAR